MTYIYALIDPITSECRYIGKANNIHTRWRKHVVTCKAHRTYKATWMRGLLRQGIKPEAVELERVSKSTWVEAEQFWIEYFRGLGARLTNLTAGGEGSEGFKHSEDVRRRLSELAAARYKEGRNPLKGRPLSEEVKRMLSEKRRGSTLPEEVKRKIGEASKRSWANPIIAAKFMEIAARPKSAETRRKLSEAGKGRVHSTEARKKVSEALKGRIRSPEHCAAISAAKKGVTPSEETRRKMSAASRGKPKAAEHNAKVSAAKKAMWVERWAASGTGPSRSTLNRWKRQAKAEGRLQDCLLDLLKAGKE